MTDQPQPLDLDAIEARANNATPGPWGHFEGDDYADVAANYQATGHGSYTCLQQVARVEADWHFDDPRHSDCEDEDAAEQAHGDAAFIAAARTDVPALVAEIRRLTAELQQAQQQDAAIRCWSANTTHGSAAAEISQIINPAAPSGA